MYPPNNINGKLTLKGRGDVMAIDIIALVVSIVAALFAGTVAYLSIREQRMRLRPYVYVDSINNIFAQGSLSFSAKIMNAGLIPAENVVINPRIQVGEKIKTLTKDDMRSKAIIVPNQVFWFSQMGVSGEQFQQVMRGEVKLSFTIAFDYEGAGKKYSYSADYKFDQVRKTCTIISGSAT
jgi:hypothetical protein